MFIESDIDARLDACLAAIEAARALGVDWKTLGNGPPGTCRGASGRLALRQVPTT